MLVALMEAGGEIAWWRFGQPIWVRWYFRVFAVVFAAPCFLMGFAGGDLLQTVLLPLMGMLAAGNAWIMSSLAVERRGEILRARTLTGLFYLHPSQVQRVEQLQAATPTLVLHDGRRVNLSVMPKAIAGGFSERLAEWLPRDVVSDALPVGWARRCESCEVDCSSLPDRCS